MIDFQAMTPEQRELYEARQKHSVLVGCEQSDTVRSAFERLGFDAYSCDLAPSDNRETDKHFQCDIREALEFREWSLLIAHPPCTRLCNSGVRWLDKAPGKLNIDNYSQLQIDAYALMNDDERLAFMWAELDKGAGLFSDCWNADIPHVAVENPVMHKYAKERIRNFEKASQTVQPWWFGDKAFKATGLYMRNLPLLQPTDKLTPPLKGTPEHKAWSAVHLASPGPERAKIRSKTFQGVADAMADQWGDYIMTARP